MRIQLESCIDLSIVAAMNVLDITKWLDLVLTLLFMQTETAWIPLWLASIHTQRHSSL